MLFNTSLLAQNDSSDFMEEEKLHALEVDNHRNTKAIEVASKYGDPCEVNWDFTFEQVNVLDYAMVRIQSSLTGASFTIRNEFGKEVLKGVVSALPTTYKLSANSDFDLVARNNCDEEVIAASVSTKKTGENDPLVLNQISYNAVMEWLDSDLNISSFLAQNRTLDGFSKASLLQGLYYNGQPFRESVTEFKQIPTDKDLLGQKNLKTDDCQCVLVTLAMNYSLSPMQRLRSDGRISGISSSELNQRFAGDDIRADQYWLYEGPARYEEMFLETLRCDNNPRDFFWNRDGVEDNSAAVSPLDLTASIDYTWICTANNGVVSNCGCDRTVNFEWDYQSVVRANAEIINGGWFCGSGRRAYAAAIDNMEVVYSERLNPSASQVLAMQFNGQTSTCSQTYVGPTAGDFLEFAYNIYLLSQGPPSSSGGGASQAAIESAWQNNLVNEVITQIDEALDEPWLDRTACATDLGGQRRSLLQSGNNRNFTAIMSPNNPINVTLGAMGSLEGGGRRKWRSNASIYSSFRLAGIMQGGGSPDPDNDCCSPYVASWLLSTVAEAVPGSVNESNYQNATRGFFNLNGLFTNVWSETGDRVNYNGFNCPSPVNVTIVKPLTGGFDDMFEAKGGSTGVNLEIVHKEISQHTINFRMFTSAGQLVTSSVAKEPGRSTLNTSGLPAGVYFLSAILPDGRPVTKKLFLWN